MNQSEIERIARQFLQAGHAVVADAAQADLVVINTCAVTAKAASDSRGKLRQAVRKNPKVKIISTGCWSTLEPERTAQMENIVQVVLNAEKEELVQSYLGIDQLETAGQTADVWPPIPGSHAHVRAFIKVQDGCDNFCTFCVTRIARGKSISLAEEAILSEIQKAAEAGVPEIVLSGVNLGAWGRDFQPGSSLSHLIKQILQYTEIRRIRLSSLEPWDIDEKFLQLWENPRLCRHFHLPLQSGSNTVLKRMGRRITREDFLDLAIQAQNKIPDVTLTTDIIVGFPGESAADFAQTMQLVEQIGFAGGHVFSYSPRPGTPALTLAGDIDADVKKERSRQLRALFQQSGQRFRLQQLNKTFEVLWEKSEPEKNGGWLLSGLTDSYLRTQMHSPYDAAGCVEKVRLQAVEKMILSATR